MATLYTHAAVGLALAKICTGRRLPVLCWVLAGLLPIIPDLDAFSDARYGTPLGHRGFTHSLCFAAVVGLVAAVATFHRFKANWWMLTGLFFLVTASHGALDAFTNGGEGIPFLWPFSGHRFGPWGPIQVADIADQFPNPWRSRAIRTEFLWVWLPLTLVIAIVETNRYRKKSRSKSPAEKAATSRNNAN